MVGQRDKYSDKTSGGLDQLAVPTVAASVSMYVHTMSKQVVRVEKESAVQVSQLGASRKESSGLRKYWIKDLAKYYPYLRICCYPYQCQPPFHLPILLSPYPLIFPFHISPLSLLSSYFSAPLFPYPLSTPTPSPQSPEVFPTFEEIAWITPYIPTLVLLASSPPLQIPFTLPANS